jgi:SAM-dependent methyltransferase
MNLMQAAAIQAHYKSVNISKEIHPNDVMFNTGKDFYFTVGQSSIDLILSYLSIAWTPQVSRVLDLPCGHGRVARHLAAAFPAAELFFCDIDSEGADFCASNFGGTAIHSRPDLTMVRLPANLDLIWVGSLFTHLNKARTFTWLRYLISHLAPHGIIVATLHGEFSKHLFSEHPDWRGGVDWNQIMKGVKTEGFGFAPYPDDAKGEYGLSISDAETLLTFAKSVGEARVIAYSERVWGYNHDVLVMTKQPRLERFPDT